VRTPDGCTQLDWEIELAVVMGRRADHVSEADALDDVAGYTVANDLSMRDFALRPDTPFGVDWLRSKAYATCLPLGPAVVPARFVPDPQDLALRLWVGDELMQDSNTSEMLFGVAEQIAYLSEIVPLLPGDVISTGTPAGVGFARDRFLQPGEVVTAEIEHVGRLVNRIA
jgi:2-keto-4-pentenoate hydratase/2-oxohepta-3-ene-1,7-dioic acid hydratase in catechol pathway